jgi:hypothetical protein
MSSALPGKVPSAEAGESAGEPRNKEVAESGTRRDGELG